jgi:hypothetical protein
VRDHDRVRNSEEFDFIGERDGMDEKERSQRGLGTPPAGQAGNRARKATMVFGGSQAQRIRSEVSSFEDAEQKLTGEREGVAKDPFEYDIAGEASGMKQSGGGGVQGGEKAHKETEVEHEDAFGSYDDIFDLPSEGAPSTTEPLGALADPFDVPLDEEPQPYAPPEPPKPAAISVGKIVRPSAQMPPAIVAPVPPEVAPMHEVQIPAPEAPKVHVQAQGVSMTSNHEQIFWKNDGPLVGFLVSFDHNPRGSYVELRTGRLIISSQKEESGSCLVVADPSVSPMHAIMRVASGGVLQVLDQLSESGTRIIHNGSAQETFLSGEKANVGHGDVVFFGERKFHVCLILTDSDR